MSSVVTIGDHACSGERGIDAIATLLQLDICSYLEVHDQRAMQNVCKRWRSNLATTRLSQCVDMDISKIPIQGPPERILFPVETERYGIEYDAYVQCREDHLEHMLKQYLHKKTKILKLRHVAFSRNQFRIVEKVIKEKGMDLIRLILQDCTEKTWNATPTEPVLVLIPSAGRLILDNHTIRDVLRDNLFMLDWVLLRHIGMPYKIQWTDIWASDHKDTPLPIVLSHYEFDRSQPIDDHYRSFISALEANCPEVSPQVRDDVVRLYHWWKERNIPLAKWQKLGRLLIRSMNKWVRRPADLPDGFPKPEPYPFNHAQYLCPTAFNKLTMEGLHRAFCLPGQ